MEYVVGVDIGGTFTDCVAVDEAGIVSVGKALSTPPDFADGALNAVRDAAERLGLPSEQELLAQTRLFFHAATVGDNTLLTRSGPKTGLLTTKGFGDTILMMRGKTTEGLTEMEAAHLSTLKKPDPIVPRQLIVPCLGISALVAPHLKRPGGNLHEPEQPLVGQIPGVFAEPRIPEACQRISRGYPLDRTQPATLKQFHEAATQDPGTRVSGT
jgi:hypothetical protein